MKTRPLLVAMLLLLGPASSTQAQFSFDIGLPNINIGFNMGSYPQLVLIPGSPVYYAPRLDTNFFFYDGLYWVYRDDDWFSSSWYNGPWEYVAPQYVPLFVLRVPVRYYRQPPQYFRGWRADAPPRWGQHWGRDWETQRSGWSYWDRRSVPAAAPLPTYQRQYRGNNYPRAPEQQHLIRAENYRYQPREKVSREPEQKRGHPENARPAQQRDVPNVQPPPRQQTPPTPRGNLPNRANDAPQGAQGHNDRQRENNSREPEPPRVRSENARPDQRRDTPDVQQQPRQQTAPNPPQQKTPAQQRFGPPTEARDAPQGAHPQNDNSESKGKENRGNDQGRDRH